jgi:hypothetical protein
LQFVGPYRFRPRRWKWRRPGQVSCLQTARIYTKPAVSSSLMIRSRGRKSSRSR